MKADIGRVTFNPDKHFLRVVMQQGRVQLEQDWNEQIALLLHYMQALAADLIGPWGGPAGSFAISATDPLGNSENTNFFIAPGHYYVDGILCDNDSDVPSAYAPLSQTSPPYKPQPYYTATPLALPTGEASHYLVYLDVWERLITAYEDDDIREVALGGADTAARTQVVWQVKTLGVKADVLDKLTCETIHNGEGSKWLELKQEIELAQRGQLRAQARPAQAATSTDPCIINPQARFRGGENALYRVEIHEGGSASAATFKWSRDNGAVVFPILDVDGSVVRLTSLGRDSRLGLQPGQWVEYVDDDLIYQNRVAPLRQVASVDPIEMTVTLTEGLSYPDGPSGGTPVTNPDPTRHPLLRRWDQRATSGQELRAGAVKVIEQATGSDKWQDLEDGVQVQFLKPSSGSHDYRPGDYWLIPARTATGDVIWPRTDKKPDPRPPDGVEHHYAPLARIEVAANGTVSVHQPDFRRQINQLWHC